MKFKSGDFVRCIIPNIYLIKNRIYKVTKSYLHFSIKKECTVEFICIEDNYIDVLKNQFYAERFQLVNKYKLPEYL